jgi:hypothetical protein
VPYIFEAMLLRCTAIATGLRCLHGTNVDAGTQDVARSASQSRQERTACACRARYAMQSAQLSLDEDRLAACEF